MTLNDYFNLALFLTDCDSVLTNNRFIIISYLSIYLFVPGSRLLELLLTPCCIKKMHLIIVSGFLYSSLFSQDLLTEARGRLAVIAKDPDNYSVLLEGLVLQVKLVIFPCGQDGTFH